MLGTLDVDVAPFVDFKYSRTESKFLVPPKKGAGQEIEVKALVSCRQLQGRDEMPSSETLRAEESNLSDMSSCTDSDSDSELGGQLNTARAGIVIRNHVPLARVV